MKGGLLARLDPQLAKSLERPKRGLLGRIEKAQPKDARPPWLRNLQAKDFTGHSA